MHHWPIDFDQGAKTIQWGEVQPFQQMVLEQLNIYMEKNEFGVLPCTTYKS